MSAVTLQSRKIVVGAIVLCAFSLGLGFIGGWASAQPVETTIEPPPTLFDMGAQMLKAMCFRNTAVDEFLNADRQRIQRDIVALEVVAKPFSDRGMVCNLVGTLAIHERYGSSRTYRKEPFNISVAVAITGEAEIVNSEIATALVHSKAVGAMASNVGNDGTIVPVLKLRF